LASFFSALPSFFSAPPHLPSPHLPSGVATLALFSALTAPSFLVSLVAVPHFPSPHLPSPHLLSVISPDIAITAIIEDSVNEFRLLTSDT